MPAAGTASRFRRRNLNFKAHLAILRESDLDESQNDAPELDEAINQVQTVKTGVDEVEEREHHLQAVIKASQAAAKGIPGGKLAQTYIPTPEAIKSNVPYNELYRQGAFAQPATYIRFSSTVEDCTGTAYSMDEEDETFLESLNARAEEDKAGARAGKRCSEDQFEAVMNAYEETSQARQPFASVDGTPVLPFEEMVGAFDEFENDDLDEVARSFAEDIYAHWKERKTGGGMRSLMPRLKTLNMDQPSKDADDADPYVCFRRREVKQMRRTRGRDSQVVERLKKLRRELEEGRQLVHWVKNREEAKRDDMKLSRQMFEQRAAVRDLKRTLNITDDDEDLLINQRTPKRRTIETSQNARQQPQMVRRQDSLISLPDFDVVQYRDKLKQREDAITREIEARLHHYEKWNADFIDRTQDFLEGVWLPQDEFEQPKSSWVSIKADGPLQEPQQQPTPPESVVDGDAMDVDKPGDGGEDRSEVDREEDAVKFRWTTPPDTDSSEDSSPRMVYRRRMGRGGMMLDRRRLRGRPRKDMDSKAREVYRYDVDSGEEDDFGKPRIDPQHSSQFKMRQNLRVFEAKTRHMQQQAAAHQQRMASMAVGGGSRN